MRSYRYPHDDRRIFPPTDPADPVAAALDHLVRAPEAATGIIAFRDVLQDLAAILDAQGVFVGLGWRDARQAAAIIAFDAVTEQHPEAVLRDRARVLLAGDDRYAWGDGTTVARALTVAANVLDTS